MPHVIQGDRRAEKPCSGPSSRLGRACMQDPERAGSPASTIVTNVLVVPDKHNLINGRFAFIADARKCLISSALTSEDKARIRLPVFVLQAVFGSS